jgi:hypothetical protein
MRCLCSATFKLGWNEQALVLTKVRTGKKL